jgi:hypothetical protein
MAATTTNAVLYTKRHSLGGRAESYGNWSHGVRDNGFLALSDGNFAHPLVCLFLIAREKGRANFCNRQGSGFAFHGTPRPYSPRRQRSGRAVCSNRRSYSFERRRNILLPWEIEPPIVQSRMTCEVANGRGLTARRNTALDGQASCSPGDQLAQG